MTDSDLLIESLQLILMLLVCHGYRLSRKRKIRKRHCYELSERFPI